MLVVHLRPLIALSVFPFCLRRNSIQYTHVTRDYRLLHCYTIPHHIYLPPSHHGSVEKHVETWSKKVWVGRVGNSNGRILVYIALIEKTIARQCEEG
jgi:hypothetical protein